MTRCETSCPAPASSRAAPRAGLPCASRRPFRGDGVVERALEAVQHVVDVGEARLFQRDAGVERAVAAAADQHDRAVHARDLLHLADEMRVDLPVGTVVPGDVMRADRMTDEEVLHLAAAVDEDRRRIVVEELGRLRPASGASWPQSSTRRDRSLCPFGGRYNRRRESAGCDCRAGPAHGPMLESRAETPASRTFAMQPDRTAELAALLEQRILILDGAMGTMIQSYKLGEAEYRGARLRRPHARPQGRQRSARADATRRDPRDPRRVFRGRRRRHQHQHVQRDVDRAGGLSSSRTACARSTSPRRDSRASAPTRGRREPRTSRASSPARSGPTNRTASISPDVNDPGARNVRFDELVASYGEAIEGLAEGGADLFLVETIFDTLNGKAALFALESYFDRIGRRFPVIVSGTITDASGRTLSGQTTEAFWNSVRHVRPLAVGINCSLGAALMRPYIEELARVADTYVSCYPNAGLPNPMAETGYDETPRETARMIEDFAQSGFVNLVGGCCGTTPAHIRAIAEAVASLPPRQIPVEDRLPPRPHPARVMRLSGLEPLNIGDDSLFVNVGERTNVTGSRAFAKLILAGDYTGAVDVARQQVANGAQILDVNMDEAMLDSKAAMVQVPEPDRCGARHRARAGDDRLVEVGGHRGGAEVRAGQARRQLDLDEGGRGRVPASGDARPALRRGGDRDGLRRARPGRHVRAQDRDLRARLRSADARGRLSRRGHRLRPEHLRDRHGHRGAQQLRRRLHQRDALDPRAPAAREGVGGRVERQLLVSAATTRCARRSTRCSSTTRSAPG